MTSDRRQFVLGGALLAASGAALALRPGKSAEMLPRGALRRLIPRTIGRYRFATSTGLVVPEIDGRVGIYDQVLTRIYVADGLPSIMLLIAYGSAQDAGLAVHRPEACYPSAGYTISRTSRVGLSGVDGAASAATFLSARRDDHVEQIYFWTRIGAAFPATPLRQQIDVLTANLRGETPDGILVRLSVLSTDPLAALPILQAFNEGLLGAVGPEGRNLLLGRNDRATA
jgi:EpsI family protein